MEILVPHSLLRRRFHKDSRYPKDNSTVSVCIAANCVLQKRPRVAHSCSHCHELLADKKHTRAHNGTEARWPMYRSDGRTAFKIHRQKNTDKMRRRRCHPRCGEHQHCQTKKEGMQSHSYVQAGPYSPPSRKELKRRTSSFMFHKTNLSSRLAHTGLEDTLRSFCEPLTPH